MIKVILVKYTDEKAKKKYIKRYKQTYRKWWLREDDRDVFFGALVELRSILMSLFKVPASQLNAWEEEIERREGAVDEY